MSFLPDCGVERAGQRAPVPDRLDTEVHQADRADQLKGGEDGDGALHHGADAQRPGDHLHVDAYGIANHRRQAGGPTQYQRGDGLMARLLHGYVTNPGHKGCYAGEDLRTDGGLLPGPRYRARLGAEPAALMSVLLTVNDGTSGRKSYGEGGLLAMAPSRAAVDIPFENVSASTRWAGGPYTVRPLSRFVIRYS